MLIPRWPKNIAMCSDAPDLDSHYNVKSCTNHGCWYKDFTTLLFIVTFLTISFISFFVPILQIKRKLVYLFDSVNYLFFFLKLFVTRINCYFLLGPFANGEAAPTLIPYIYDPVIKHSPRPDHLEMVRNNIILPDKTGKTRYLYWYRYTSTGIPMFFSVNVTLCKSG